MTSASWEEAEYECQAKYGASVASVHNNEENEYIRKGANAAFAASSIWIGMERYNGNCGYDLDEKLKNRLFYIYNSSHRILSFTLKKLANLTDFNANCRSKRRCLVGQLENLMSNLNMRAKMTLGTSWFKPDKVLV